MFDDMDLATIILGLVCALGVCLVGWWVISMLWSFHSETMALLQTAGAAH